MAKAIKSTRGGARPGSGKKTYLENPVIVRVTVPMEHREELKKQFLKMVDKYRKKKINL